MKKKILFYGNCQVGVIARFFRLNLSDMFEVQLCTDCGLTPFWNENGLYAVWSKENRETQEEYKRCVQTKIKESDIFIFQDHSGRSVIDELKTKYLYDEFASGLKICVPDTRFFAYLVDAISLVPYVSYIKTKETNSDKIIKYLQESDDSKLSTILLNEYPFNKKYEMYRNENTQRFEKELSLYNNVIGMGDYMEKEFQNKLLSVSHNHMNECYFIELINRLYSILGISITEYPIENLKFPGFDSIDPRQFNFFIKMFPNLDYGNFKGRKLRTGDVI